MMSKENKEQYNKETRIVEAYNNGESMNAIANDFNTYPTTIKRILEKHDVKLRHDAKRRSKLYVKNGEQLIEWAKAQDRLVTKAELAKVAGTKRLSPSYFFKYPELGQYVENDIQDDLKEYYQKLYKWLKENDIPYKPMDRTKLKISVDALLLGEYSNFAIQIAEKPRHVDKKKYEKIMKTKFLRAKEAGITIIFLNKENFENLDNVKILLDDLKVKNNSNVNKEEKEEKYNLAKMYYFGVKVEQNYKNAFNLFNDLVEKCDDKNAKFFLIEMYYCGYYVEEDKRKAFNLYKELIGDYVSEREWFYNDIMLFSIIEYSVEIGCITEENAKKYLSMSTKFNYEKAEIIRKFFKKTLPFVDFNIKVKILKYVQQYVKRFYNEDSVRQEFAEKILDELLKYISFYDPKYIIKYHRGYVGDIEKSLMMDELVLKDLFSYPTRKYDYAKRARVLSDEMSFLKTIIHIIITANKLSFAAELMELLYNTNQEYFKDVFNSLMQIIKIEKKKLNIEQIELLKKWKSFTIVPNTNNLKRVENPIYKKQPNFIDKKYYMNEIDSKTVIEQKGMYAKLYEDGTLILSPYDYTDTWKRVKKDYNFENISFEDKQHIKDIIILDKIIVSKDNNFIKNCFTNLKVTRLDLKNLDFSNTDLRGMFRGCKNLEELKLSNFDISNVGWICDIFPECENLKILDLSNIDFSNVEDLSDIFKECENLEELKLSGFNTSKIRNMSEMFSLCKNLKKIDISNFDTSNVKYMKFMFYKCENLEELNLTNFNTSNVIDMRGMFRGLKKIKKLNLSNFDTSKVIDMSQMFMECESLEELKLLNFNTSNVKDMHYMFRNLKELKELDLSSFNTYKVTNMDYMFGGCEKLEKLNLSSFDTSNVTDMGEMFYKCKNLKVLDLSNFDTSNVVHMYYMFNGCENIEKLNLSNFNTSNVIRMDKMFYKCEKLKELDLSNFNTSNVLNMNQMFMNCESLENLNISNFDISKVKWMSSVFDGCIKLKEKIKKTIDNK